MPEHHTAPEHEYDEHHGMNPHSADRIATILQSFLDRINELEERVCAMESRGL